MSPDDPDLVVRKASAYMPISFEMALDCGLMTEEEARAAGWVPSPPTVVPRRVRLRWRWQALRERLGRRAGGWIAGVALTDRDDE